MLSFFSSSVSTEDGEHDGLTVIPFPAHVSEVQDGEGHHPHPHHHHRIHRFRRPHSFAGRLSSALMTLGPWEGRAVAFVLGESRALIVSSERTNVHD